MPTAKNKYASVCHRCDGKGYYPAKYNGNCFACGGRKFVAVKTSKHEKLFRHTATIDGVQRTIVTWGKDADQSWRVAVDLLTAKGYHIKWATKS